MKESGGSAGFTWRHAGLALGALGVVYGDIGTSPLYAMRECFGGHHPLAVTRGNVLGVLSLFIWSLILIVSVKYLVFVMRADNKGEGGILALMSLAFPERRGLGIAMSRTARVMVGLGLFGAALLYGDGMITPAMSVLGAVEGLNEVAPALGQWVVPITVVILSLLFLAQSAGTGAVGRVFGPVMIIWFVAISILGVRAIAVSPGVMAAINPAYGLVFLVEGGWKVFPVLGSVFLAVTGGEALYADMGHFGRRPIRQAWFTLVLPALVLNYLGQGALLLSDPLAASNPFYNLAPKWALIPLVVLATAAAVIASQALITGVFSLTMQGIQLGYIPRLVVEHTSERERGQIYLPQVNAALAVACLGLVLEFRSTTNLAAAYGIAVTLTMAIVTVLFYFAARKLWRWSWWMGALVCVPVLTVELAFFGANALKITHGGWVPLVVGAGLFTLMVTWKRGRQLLGQRMRSSAIPVEKFIESVERRQPQRVEGTAVYMAGNSDGTPLALLHNLKHNKVLHRRVIFLTVGVDEDPRVPDAERVEIEKLTLGFWRVKARFGFFEEPNVPLVLALCEGQGLEFKETETTFFLSRETVLPSKRGGMALWRERVFALMARNAQSATAFFHLPANRVVELGMQVEI
ncbi:MAG: potassium transporter Kup [Verrucomicrobiota bacterium]|jgi:KUP system potassium uptake protein